MIKIQGKIPRTVYVAVSGGVDSMAIVDFLYRNHDVHMVYVNHGDEASKKEVPFLIHYSMESGIGLSIYNRPFEVPVGVSKEHFWSMQRKEVFSSLDGDIILCHHLDDCMETWIVSSLQGKPSLISYRTMNIIRPFRLTSKSELVKWCNRNNVKWVHDKTNDDPSFGQRNYVRNVMMENVLKVNPGFRQTVRKLLEEDYE